MIGYLKGKVISINGNDIILATSAGVGYSVNLVNTSAVLDQQTEVYVHTNVSENDISLWGFSSPADLKLFKMLLDVSGVGSRTAQSLMQTLGSGEIVKAISAEDDAGLKAPGVGRKTAQRIIIDLSSKVDQLFAEFKDMDSDLGESSELKDDAMAAVIALGYAESDVRAVLKQLDIKEFDTSQALIKELLKHV